MILVTGGAGFIGSNFVRAWLLCRDERLCVLDALTYAGNLENLASVSAPSPLAERWRFEKLDLRKQADVDWLINDIKPRAIIHFAAESHVDRSILGPGDFIQTNVVGTFNLLESARKHWQSLSDEGKDRFRFLHVSTDEVYGSLGAEDPAFRETTPYAPNSPYSASKAASDHLVRAWHHTYGLPTLTTNCSNNYGPFQFPEKLIPLMIASALEEKPLPVYGDGQNVRDWLHVQDHCEAIMRVLEAGRPGEVYNIGGHAEMKNLDVVHTLCAVLDRLKPKAQGSYADQIQFVTDRPGHDRRYAIDSRKIREELAWSPAFSFEMGIEQTVKWYLNHTDWVDRVKSGAYREWIDANYQRRSPLAAEALPDA
ncbi:MAG: dTDP-glucose 4,6-dehydratase [Betaproteobacteria bacterium]|nr:dTDP-glucose 4,6-dehydratase [Betaproteobacteria bacterium]NDD11155.1 dTDP-glucose 4,6-dehydratase [Betaproteobacteria bacterium]